MILKVTTLIVLNMSNTNYNNDLRKVTFIFCNYTNIVQSLKINV